MIQTKRRWVQTFFLLLLHSFWGYNVAWFFKLKLFCNPVLSCHSCALAWFTCPVGIWVHYSGWHLFPYVAIGTTVLLGVLIGRMLCGWVCPFGFLQDLVHKIPTRKFELPSWTSYVKYAVLVLTVFLFPFLWGESTQLSFCRVCPSSALQVTIPYLVEGGTWTVTTYVKLGLLVGVVGLAIVAERSFCKVFCPIGAFLAPLNYLSFWKVRWPTSDCLACQQCDAACPTNVDPSLRIEEGIPPNRALDCIVCHQCQPECPQREEDEF